jgi:hypothetical protein
MNPVGALENNGLDKASFKPSELDLIAASLRLDTSDIESSLTALAELLRSISPTGVKVRKRKKALFSKETVVEEISIRLGDQVYAITNSKSPNPIVCSRSKIVRDIVIKTDELTMDKWAASLAQQAALEAERSAESRAALNRILGLS